MRHASTSIGSRASQRDGRVTMLCGSGCEGAHDEVSRWPIA